MARGKKPSATLFDLGFPIHSRTGLKQVTQITNGHAATLDAMQQRAGFYGERELNELAEPLIGMWSRVVSPANEQLTQHQANYNVLQQAALGHADVGLLLARQRADELMPVAAKTPPTFARRNGEPQLPHELPPGNYPLATYGPGGVILSTPIEKGAPTIGARQPIPATALCQIYNAIDPATNIGRPCYAPLGAHLDPALFHPIGAPVQCSAFTQPGSPLFGILPCSAAVPPSPVPTPKSPPGAPIPPQVEPTHACPQCGCPLTLGDLDKAPGSTCDKPLYIVQCVPKKKPKPKQCPAPANVSVNGR